MSMTTITAGEPLAILIASSKGGSGKTTFARGLIDYYRDQHGIPTAAYDFDGGTESLLQFYGERDASGALVPEEQRDPIAGVRNFSIRRDRERDNLLNLFEQYRAPRTVIDLPGGGEEEVEKILGNADRFFAAYESLGIQPVVVLVINSSKSAAMSVPAITSMFGFRPHFIVAKNPVQGSRFRHFEGYVDAQGCARFGNGRRRILEAGGEVIALPRLDGDTNEDVDFYSLSWAQAQEYQRLTITDRLRVRQWRADFAAAVSSTALGVGTSLQTQLA